jgi:hypothetical protein
VEDGDVHVLQQFHDPVLVSYFRVIEAEDPILASIGKPHQRGHVVFLDPCHASRLPYMFLDITWLDTGIVGAE